jgi:cation diffusion facilitator family transporter
MEKNRDNVIVQTSIIGIFANALLVGFKAVIGFIVGSISIIMDALNNLTDALSSLITIVGTKLSAKKPNKKHPYGYGRIEYVTSTLIAALILFAGATAIVESIKSIIDYFQNGTMPDYSIVSIIIVSGAILIKIAIGLFFRKRAKQVSSDALKNSGNDALFDSILSCSTLVAALVSYFFKFYLEGYLGVVIGLFIIKSGIEALRDSLSSIIGERYDPEVSSNIKKDIKAIEGVTGAYDLIINSYGPNNNIGSVHIGVKENLSAKEIQKIERQISYLMQQKYKTIMTVGIYAENTDSKLGKDVKDKLYEILKEYKYILQMHGFYIDEEKKYVNFDLVISFEDKESEKHFMEVKNKMKEAFPDYEFIVNFDLDFSVSA